MKQPSISWSSARSPHPRQERPILCRSELGFGPVTCGVLGRSGGMRVFVDQAAQDRSSADPCGVEVGHGGAGGVTICAGDMLSDALVRPGRVVVRLIFHKDGVQMRLAEDQRPAGYLAAQGADEAFADRV